MERVFREGIEGSVREERGREYGRNGFKGGEDRGKCGSLL